VLRQAPSTKVTVAVSAATAAAAAAVVVVVTVAACFGGRYFPREKPCASEEKLVVVPARSSKPHPRAPPPDPRLKPGPVIVTFVGVITQIEKSNMQNFIS